MNEQSKFEREEDSQAVVNKSHEHFNPVVVTDTVGALFLGLISIILMAVVGGLLVRNHKLEDRLRESDHSIASKKALVKEFTSLPDKTQKKL